MITRKMKILVAESNPEERRKILDLLLRSGDAAPATQIRYELFEATSFDDAIKMFHTVFPDLVLISLQSEGLLGKKMCKEIRLREKQRHTGVIFIAPAENSNHMLSVECLELGSDDFFVASITPREMIARINAVLRLKDMTDELRSANHRLELLSLTDELTGLHNMRSFSQQFNRHLQSCREGRSGLGIIMMDLDRFKQINDRTNHLVGSHVISDVGKLMRLSGVLGPSACPARYGGDEYIVCCLADSVNTVIEQAERLRRLLLSALFTKDGFSVRVTASIGVC